MSFRKMPRRYKNKKYGRKRKRKVKKRSGRGSLGFRVARIAAKVENGWRKYYEESRISAVEVATNKIKYCVLGSMGSYQDVNNMLLSSDTGMAITDLGDTNAHTYATDKLQQRFDLCRYKQTWHFRNIDPHEVFLTVYELVARNYLPKSGSNICEDIITDMASGIREYLGSGTASTTKYTGDEIIDSTASTQMILNSAAIEPKQARRFNQNWKIVKVKKFKLNPGDDVFWKMRLKNRVFNFRKMTNDSGDTIEMIPGYTKCLMVKVHGVIGRSLVADEADVIGLMECNLSNDSVTSCSILPLEGHDTVNYAELNVDDLTTKTLVAPSDDLMHVEQADGAETGL